MKLPVVAIVYCLSFLIFTSSSYAQDFDYNKYKPRTLSELVELNPFMSPAPGEKKRALVSGEWFYSRVRLKYIGNSRPIPSDRREIIANWQKLFQIPSETANLFQNEFQFKECDKDYWLPVQQQVSNYFQKELKEGDMVTLYLYFAGGMRTSSKTDWLFMVNEFEK